MIEPTAYAELHCHSYFSLLDGASSPESLVSQAKTLGLTALALTDHDSLAAAVRFWAAAQRAQLHAVIGAEVTLEDGHHLTLLAETQTGYANLCQLITASRLDQVSGRGDGDGKGDSDDERTLSLSKGKAWPGKVEPSLTWQRLAQHSAGIIALSGCRHGPLAAPLLNHQPQQAQANTQRLLNIFGPANLFVELQHHSLPDDDWLISELLDLAQGAHLRVVATHNVHYATPAESQLRDALIAIRHNQSITLSRQARLLPLNRTYALASPAEMTRRFRHLPLALQTTIEIANRCHVTLDFSQQRLPTFTQSPPSPCHPVTLSPLHPSEFEHLYQLCHTALPHRYPQLTPAVLKQLAHELEIIQQAGLAGYFLIVWDLIRFAREQGIRCQGRGSAANSIVAYLLQITSIDPLRHNLLFERFLSEDKFTMPDIDVDFAADRREEVIQYVYARYGSAHTAMVCNVNTYQARSAMRDLAKALDFPPPVIDRLAKSLDSYSPSQAAKGLLSQIEAGAANNHPLQQLASLLQQIDGCPRHLSIHSGGMLITGLPLDEIVPLEPATMPGRIIAQWNKDSVEDAGLIKIDLLALRTLGLITEAISLSEANGEHVPNLDTLPLDDPELYRMLHTADTIGTFQVESRAQQQMLPRLKPTTFAEIAIEVAIVRPGPIQGGAVHPYLRRRAGQEPVSYLHESLKPVLHETMGVLLFQEQAIRVAVVAAGFAPGEADMLRRALSRNNSEEALAQLRQRFLHGASLNHIDAPIANAIFEQLAGFAGYGFCKSHAMSFALIAYQTLYLKRYHPAAFYCALLNQQPMGFYSPEVIIGDAQRHGVDLLPPDINRSDWPYTLERTPTATLALRTGLSAIHGLGQQAYQRIAAARITPISPSPLTPSPCHLDFGELSRAVTLTSASSVEPSPPHPFPNLPDFCHRTRLPQSLISDLIRAGACDTWGPRRHLLWQLGELDYRPAEFDITLSPTEIDLPALDGLEQTAWEYELLGLSPAGQVMHHYRQALRKQGILSTWQVKEAYAGQRLRVAGMVVVKQRPATARGILFCSLEDEAGLLDLVVKPETYTQYREVLRTHALLQFEGIVQRAATAVSLLVHHVQPLNIHPHLIP